MATMADETTIKLKKLEDELELLNVSLKGKKSLESMKVLADLPTNNSKDDMLQLSRELYGLCKKTIDILKTCGDVPMRSDDIVSLVRNEMTAVLPEILKKTLADIGLQNQSSPQQMKTEDVAIESHMMYLVKKTDDPEDKEEITEKEWTEVVKKDVRSTLKNVPVIKAHNGKLSFKTKEDMDTAREALSGKYSVTMKTQEVKKLDPKLTLMDIDPDISSKEELQEKILDKNDDLRKLIDAGGSCSVIYLDQEKNMAVLRVSTEIRQHIKKNGDRICVDLQQHRVRDRFHVIQCFHCQAYGHKSGSDYCRQSSDKPICFYCAGSHSSKDCKDKKNKTTTSVKCYNCSISRNPEERRKCKTHNATDTLCPFFIREKERMMSRTPGTEEIKNAFLQKTKALQRKLGRTL